MVEGPGCKINGEKLKKRAVGQTVAGVAGAVVKKSIQQSRDGASEYDSFYGQKITDVKTLGKELFMFLECELCLRVHFLMNGSLRFNDEPVWPNNKRDAAVLRLTLTTDTIYFFDTAIDTRSSSESQQKHRDLIDLDICSPTFDFQRAVRTIREHPSRVISDVILDQLVLPGVGNIIKNEALFNAGINPNSKVEELSEELVSLLVKTNRDFTKIFYECRRGGGDLRKHMKVYKKSECQECGRKLMQCRIGENERLTFFCASCQTNTLRLPSKNSLLGWVYNVKDGWTCAICTLENKGGVSRCSACLTPRPQTQGPNVSARVLAATASPVRGNKRKFEGGGGDAHSAKRSASVFGHGSHLAGTHASPASPAPKRASAPATPQVGRRPPPQVSPRQGVHRAHGAEAERQQWAHLLLLPPTQEQAVRLLPVG
ncbi:endonuclease 8-like 3 isoform X2 [Eriocheir sinensis]|uniref:endonuclease 8-like 3 isoform X2 n=1 Tax=Eriocheir sinensis TaxID=95602 RepID=UPI0021C7C034|nr:endonuclease 8-like 3 isoform X2 [Eriocheir sinensis]